MGITPVIPALGQLRQEDDKISLNYMYLRLVQVVAVYSWKDTVPSYTFILHVQATSTVWSPQICSVFLCYAFIFKCNSKTKIIRIWSVGLGVDKEMYQDTLCLCFLRFTCLKDLGFFLFFFIYF